MKLNTRYIIGIILILLGVGFLLDSLHLIDISFGELFQDWWALIFVFIGVGQIISRPDKLTSGLFWIGLGGLIIAHNLYDIEFWETALPLALIIWGIGFLIRDKNSGTKVQVKHTFSLGSSSKRANELDDEIINISAVFSGSSHRVHSQSFRGGNISSTFGGVELDLRSASMASNEASLDVDCSFGGVEIKVPQSWHVVVQGTPIFGGIENDTIQRAIGGEHECKLTVRASVMFGGLEIKN